MSCIGIDVSKYNLGWDPAKASKPIGFVIQRASWSLYRDEQFDAINKGVASLPVRGAYHYYSSGVPWKTQADLFLKVVKDKGFHFYCVDYERAFNTLSGRTIAEVAEMVKYIKAQTGQRCLIYFSPSIYNENIKPCGYAAWARQQEIWIAQYPWTLTQNPPTQAPQIPDGLPWRFWQYGGGDVNFTAGRHAGPDYGGGLAGMDLNYFNGSFDELLAWAGSAAGTTQFAQQIVLEPGLTHSVVTTTKNLGWLKPRYVPKGPAIIAGSDAPKANHPNIPLDIAGQTFIKDLNGKDADVWRIFADEFVGPSKGLDPVSGKLKYIMAGWSGNVVSIVARLGSWIKIESIDLSKGLPLAGVVNHEKTPHLVHRMTTVNAKNEFISYPRKNGVVSPWDRLNDPLISTNGEFWIPAEWVEEVATLSVGVNVRSGPGKEFPVVSSLKASSKVDVLSLKRDALGNKWARLGETTWCCLEYQGSAYSSWRLF